MLKQLRRADLSGVALWEDHWRQFDEIRFDAKSIRWDGFLDIVNERAHIGPILEAGCGLGRYLLYLRSRGARAVGVDFALQPLSAIHAQVGSAPIAVADLRQLPFDSNSFATILCLGVIEHFEQGPGDVLNELKRTLRPGGLLIVTVPYANLMKRWHQRRRGSNIVGASAPPPNGFHFYQFCYSSAELRQVVESVGLRVVAERRLGRLFTFASLLTQWRRTAASAAEETPRREAAPRRSASMGHGWIRSAIRELAFHGQSLLPGVALAHMVMVVGQKPAAAATNDRGMRLAT